MSHTQFVKSPLDHRTNVLLLLSYFKKTFILQNTLNIQCFSFCNLVLEIGARMLMKGKMSAYSIKFIRLQYKRTLAFHAIKIYAWPMYWYHKLPCNLSKWLHFFCICETIADWKVSEKEMFGSKHGQDVLYCNGVLGI